jgi:hypothetical protein
MRRNRTIAFLLATFVGLSCGEAGERALGPASQQEDSPEDFSAAVVPGTNVTLPPGCLDYWDPETATAGVQSPCDAVRPNTAEFPTVGYPGVYLLPPMVGSVPTGGTFQSGLAGLLNVSVERIGDCDPEDPADGRCAPYDLTVTENPAGPFYETDWKTRKKPVASAPAVDSNWRILIQLTLGGETFPIAYRDVQLSDTPSLDQPSDDPLLVIQRGSNQPIKFFISDESCNNTGDVAVTCLIGDGGGTLYIGGPNTIPPTPNVAFTVGAGNGARSWTAEFVDGDVDVDVPVFGRTVRVTADPPPAAALIGSSILFCEETGSGYTFPGPSLYVIQEDENGQSVLPPIAAPDCSLFETATANFDFLGTGMEMLASLVLPKPLVATSAVGSLSGGGGSVKRLSDFQLGVPVAATPEGLDPDLGDVFVVSSGTEPFYEIPPVTATVDVRTITDEAAYGSTVHFFPDTDGELACVTGTSCSIDAGVASVVTGADGKASILWTSGGGGVRELKALGCGLAVPGSDTPATAGPDGVLGLLQNCDRDPEELTDGDATDDGYANGPASGTDPFEPIDDNEVALNDLPITFTVNVRCETLGVDSVTCPFGEDGGTLRIEDGTQVEVVIGAGNGEREYTLEFVDGADIDVDVPVFGRLVRVTAEPPFDFDSGERLNGSTISFCEETGTYETPGSSKLYVVQQDDQGTTALPEPDVPVTCPLFPTQSSLLDLVGDGVTYLASLVAPKQLVATSAVGSLSGGGGSVKRLSEFQLTVQASAEATNLNLGTVRLGDWVTAQVDVENDGTAVPDATVWFYADVDGSLACVDGNCTGPNALGGLGVITGADGAARISWRPGSSGSPVLRALGCGIAVPGSDTPATAGADGVLGLLQNCDRDPLELQDGDTTDDGYANGTRAGNDPFEPVLDIEIALNDLPIEITASVCGTQGTANPDGIREDAWNCAESIPFPVNLSGPSGQTDATLLWMNDNDNLYLAVQLPRDAEESSTSLWFEFDAGTGSAVADGTADENDDLFGLELKRGLTRSDLHLTAKCAASEGTSVCGESDDEPDVSGDVKYNGNAPNGFLFYEMSHPLTGGGPQDFDLEVGDVVGMFLRLALGNGAQGNTIYPDFRVYHPITIR